MNGYNCIVCPRCECVKESDAAIERMTKKITYLARESEMNLLHMNQEMQELSGGKTAKNAVDETQGIASVAGVNDGGYDVADNDYPISLHYEKQKKEEDVSGITVAVDEKKIYTMEDLTIYMMNEADC